MSRCSTKVTPRNTFSFTPSIAPCGIVSGSKPAPRSKQACAGCISFCSRSEMAPASPRELAERELHEYVAGVEGHDSQTVGVVGYFYRMYRAEVLARVGELRGRDVLQIGCGEGMMFDGTS